MAQISEINYSLISCGIFPKEQKGCCKRTRDAGELQVIEQHILNESKMRQKNLAMTLIDCKNAYKKYPKAEYYTVSKYIEYLMNSYSLLKRSDKFREWN